MIVLSGLVNSQHYAPRLLSPHSILCCLAKAQQNVENGRKKYD